jgi:hypothetical protein
MDAYDYLRAASKSSGLVFDKTLQDESRRRFGDLNNRLHYINEFATHIDEKIEREAIITACAQLDSAILCACHGFYRQAFSSIRLALELSLGVINLSAKKIFLIEWSNGAFDISWSDALNEVDGVFSKKFVSAFFGDLGRYPDIYRQQSKDLYRRLSEYVHGNVNTWTGPGEGLVFNDELKNGFFEKHSQCTKIVLFCLWCRYAKTFNSSQIESIKDCMRDDFCDIVQIKSFLEYK